MPLRLTLAVFICANFVVALSAQDDAGITGMDTSVRPQDDLFRYVNGTWLDETEIPADKSNFGSFIELDDQAREHIRELIEELAESEAEPGSNEQKIGDFFKSYMNTRTVGRRGIVPLKKELRKVNSIRTVDDVFRHFGYLQKIGVSSPCGFFVSQDAGDSTRYISQLTQSGLTMPDRDYYLSDDEKSTKARKAMLVYIEQLFELCRFHHAEESAREIMELETQLAQAQIPRVELRNAEKRYNPFTVEEVQSVTANLDWDRFLSEVLEQEITEVNVNTPAYFDALNQILVETDPAIWRKYLKFRIVDEFAPILSAEFVDAHFDFHSKAIDGIEEQLPRWKRAVNAISGGGAGSFGALGDAVGKLYVEKHFPPEAKRQMDQLVENLLAAFGDSIDDLEWMTEETKSRAKEKLSKINTKIGYTTRWRDYSELEVSPTDLFANVINSNRVEFRRMTDRLGQPVDRERWSMTPQTVNAYYNPTLNEIVFPAAILQSPFFSVDAEPALNYGGIGAVIGHEISHAFDDQGSKYDGDGNLNNWWTDRDRQAFQELADQLVQQFEEYEPLDGKFVNGQLTLGENIADLSGLSIAHKAYRMSLDGKEPEKVAGWTGDQLFFVGWSRVWRRKYRDAEMVKRLLIDPHAPSQYRTNGPITNIDAFYTAFDLKEGDELFKPRDERIKIW